MGDVSRQRLRVHCFQCFWRVMIPRLAQQVSVGVNADMGPRPVLCGLWSNYNARIWRESGI